MLWHILYSFAILSGAAKSAYNSYEYRTYFYSQKVDHFSFTNTKSFKQRYLVGDKYWNKNGAPIFFYAGNEGDITLFAENTGFIWNIAPEFKALIVFAEHRYYGVSLPFGNKSYTGPQYTGYLTSEQALADYAELLTHIKFSVKGAKDSPVIAFGGSYGGMLAAWFRMKYPHIVHGSIAASAPILQFMGLTPCEEFGQVVTADFSRESEMCANIIRKSWSAINNVTTKKGGMAWLTKAWCLCRPLKSKSDVTALKEYLTDVWTNLAMADYPYPAAFLAPLPGYPIKSVCKTMKDADKPEALLQELFKGVSVYFNFTRNAKCLNFEESSDQRLDSNGWDVQMCNEMVMPMCYDGKKDFFEPSPWNYTSYAENCQKKLQLTPQPLFTQIMYGGKKLNAASNIVFSNGDLDPWSTGGVKWNVSSSVLAVTIADGAHHLDLRAPDPNDPPSVTAARNFEKQMITTWIAEHRRNNEIIQ